MRTLPTILNWFNELESSLEDEDVILWGDLPENDLVDNSLDDSDICEECEQFDCDGSCLWD